MALEGAALESHKCLKIKLEESNDSTALWILFYQGGRTYGIQMMISLVILFLIILSIKSSTLLLYIL